MKRIMIIEDEAFMREELADMLGKAGYDILCPEKWESIAEYILEQAPDLILLDVNLPGRSGFEICREVKRKSSIPVLILTSRDQLRDELHALELGADEFLTKPCRRERILARIANVLKRYEGRQNLLEGPGFLMDTQTYTIFIHGRSAVLPQNQGKILETLMINQGELVTKAQLCQAVWGTEEFIDENALQVNLTRLKKTIAGLDMGVNIVTQRGVGYRLVDR